MADLLSILRNLVAMLPDFEFLLAAVFWVIGILFIVTGLRSAARRAEMGPSQGTYAPIMVRFLVGVAFLAFPATVSTVIASFWGSGATASPDAIFSYAPSLTEPMNSGNGREILVAITMLVQFVGYIGFARGLMLINAVTSQSGQARTFGPGITFIVASTMAVNFPLFLGAIELLVTPARG